MRRHGSIIVWNRSPGRLDMVAAEGAEVAGSPAQPMRRCDIVGLCLTAHQAVKAVAFGPAGLAEGSPEGKLVVDFSTGAPEAAADFASRADTARFGWVDAPVSGGVTGAETGTLILFAGGRAEHIAAAEPLTSAVASCVTHMRLAGADQTPRLGQALSSASLPIGMKLRRRRSPVRPATRFRVLPSPPRTTR